MVAMISDANPSPLQPEVRTRRLVITDETGSPRIVGEIANGAAEVRVGLPDGGHRDAYVLLYAVPRDGAGLGPDVGVQLWAEGNAYSEMTLSWNDERWAASLRTLPDPS